MFICVKCGKSHDTKMCTKPKDTPATCALCNGNHPANYKGCMVYQDLIRSKNRDNPTNLRRATPQTPSNVIQNSPTPLHPQQNTIYRPTYAQITEGSRRAQMTNNSHTNHTNEEVMDKLTVFLSEFKSMFAQLINQNSMILNMLTTVINRITK